MKKPTPERKSRPFKTIFYFLGLLLLLGGTAYLSTALTDKDEDKSFTESFKKNYRIYALTLPDEIDFAGESVPMELDEIREKLDREMLVNTYWQSQTLLFIKRSNKYFPQIEKILKEEGVPEDFKYLSIIESGFRNVVSPSGAAGFWQFLRSTGPDFGLEVNEEVDERYHLEKATRAACKYLKDAKENYGSWTLAAASYNMGQNGLSRQLDRQKVGNYYDLLLNEETSRYVFRILAVKTILQNPEEYGFNFRKQDLYTSTATTTLTVDTAIADLADFAMQQGGTYNVLKAFNPWLRKNYLKNPGKKKYQIEWPVKSELSRWVADPAAVEMFMEQEKAKPAQKTAPK